MEVKSLPERLREFADSHRGARSLIETDVLCREAADEIERLNYLIKHLKHKIKAAEAAKEK